MKTILTADRLLTANHRIDKPVLVVEDGRITGIGSQTSAPRPPGASADYPGATITAPYFDVHTHGCCGRDVMEASGDALGTIGQFLGRHGVGAYLPTTITAPQDATLRSLAGLARLIARSDHIRGARPVGIHAEGPFLSHAKRGTHPPHDLLPPTVGFFERMWQASAGTLRLLTIAPELPGALDVIARAKELGVRVSLGHSNATFAEAEAGAAAGADSATHTFNAMHALGQREPGILGYVLGNDDLYAELICDGLHVHPAAVKLFYRAKGPERAILITDGLSATNMPDGHYKLGELEVRLEHGRCLTGVDTLAGSTVTLEAAVRNFVRFTGAPLETAVRLASRNPAQMAGLTDEVGVLREGGAANLLVLSPEGAVLDTWLGGQRVE